MVKLSTNNFQRLLSSSRSLSTSKKRTSWRTRMKSRDASNAQARALKRIRRVEEKQKYQTALQEAQNQIFELANGLKNTFQKHSTQYYLEEIMQVSRLQKKKKATSAWQAFVSKEVKAINDALPEGEPRKKANMLMQEISTKWATMTADEKTAHTQDTLQQLRDTREMCELASHNVTISSFHDARVTLDHIEEEVKRLNARTNMEVICFAVRTSKEQFNRPCIIATSDRMLDFFELSLKKNVYDLNIQLEAYMLSGVQGDVAKAEVSRMYYHNFDSKITARYHVIVKNWLLPKFCSPSNIPTLTVAPDALTGVAATVDPLPATTMNDVNVSSIALITSNISNTVLGLNGEQVLIAKKLRKVRCDKGMKRGKRGDKRVQEAVTPTSSTA
ncbi:hypothetical protein C0991_011012 [Blastosporella zonata]|nr:hypothetical protein C0991_011012 [Blastosporella zonata]